MIDEIKEALAKRTPGTSTYDLIANAPAWLEHLIARVEKAEAEVQRKHEIALFAASQLNESQEVSATLQEENAKLLERVEKAEAEVERITRAAEIELEKFAGIGNRIQYENDKLRAELAEAVKVIEFYGNENNWSDVAYDSPIADGNDGDVAARIDFDDCEVKKDEDGPYLGPAGKRARAYLASRKEKKG